MKHLAIAVGFLAALGPAPVSATVWDLDWRIGIGTNLDLTITVGDTVRWTWTDGDVHSVFSTSGPSSIDSGFLVGAGTTFEFTFTEPGVWSYLCQVHPGSMRGTITVMAPANDPDFDGVIAPDDNCTDQPNSLQIDSDLDGYGNACDADYDNSGFVGSGDFNRFRSAFESVLGDPGYNPALDFDSDNAIGAPDFNFFRSAFEDPPGPSDLACAGTIPCPAP